MTDEMNGIEIFRFIKDVFIMAYGSMIASLFFFGAIAFSGYSWIPQQTGMQIGCFFGYFFYGMYFHESRVQTSLTYLFVVFCSVVVFFFAIITISTMPRGELPNYSFCIRSVLPCLLGLLSSFTLNSFLHNKVTEESSEGSSLEV